MVDKFKITKHFTQTISNLIIDIILQLFPHWCIIYMKCLQDKESLKMRIIICFGKILFRSKRIACHHSILSQSFILFNEIEKYCV